MDRKRLEARILATQDRIWFTSESNDYDIEWILQEGRMVKSFLHLEDICRDPGLYELFDGHNIVSSSDEILPVIHDFYQHLYETSDIKILCS